MAFRAINQQIGIYAIAVGRVFAEQMALWIVEKQRALAVDGFLDALAEIVVVM